MKIIPLVLALAAVALAAPADDNNEKKSERFRERGNTDYDANLKFNWHGDGTWKSRFEAALKPIAETLQALGFNGNLNSESDGKGGGDVSGHFRLTSGRRGNGESSTQGLDATIAAGPRPAVRNGGPSGFDVGSASPGVARIQGPNLPVIRTSRNAVQQSG